VVTPDDMRRFALDCLRWAEQTDDAGRRDLMIRIAKSWMNAASAIEHRTNGRQEVASSE
jgi:hypothetical protein